MDENAVKVFLSATDAAAALAPHVRDKKTVVTTNGCFDILHAGHVRYLAAAAALGHFLVVGINSDASVRGLKGPDRPLQSQQDRAFILASLKSVWGVFVFEEPDPRAFLEIIRPAVHVKGGDYKRDLVEKEVVEKHGGRVEIVAFEPGRSTSDIIRKVRSAT